MFDWEKIDRIAEAASVLIMGGGRKAKESDQCLEADKCSVCCLLLVFPGIYDRFFADGYFSYGMQT